MKTAEKQAEIRALTKTVQIAIPSERGVASMEKLEEADRQRRFEEAVEHVFTQHRELLRRLAE